MTVWAGSGEVEHHLRTPQSPAAPSSGPIRPVFQTSSGSTVMAKDVNKETLVVNPATGEVESTLGALLNAGLIRETKDGWELADSRGNFHQTNLELLQDQQQQEQQDQQQQQQEAERDYLDHADEARLRDVEAKIGGDTYAALEAVMSNLDLEQIPETLLATVSSKLGIDRDQALAAVHEHAAVFIRQAADVIEGAIGPGTAQEVLAWGRSDPKGREILQQAMRGQLDQRDVSGFTRLAGAWLIDTARKDPERVAEGLRQGGTPARVVGKDVIVDLGKAGGGETSLAAAIRGDVISIGKPHRRSGRR